MIHVSYVHSVNAGDHADRISEAIGDIDPNMTLAELIDHIQTVRGYRREIDPYDVIEIRVSARV